MNWNEKIDQVKEKLGLSTDAAVARALGVTPQYLSDVRRGGKPASIMLKFRILDKLAYVWTADQILDVLPEDVQDGIKDSLRAIRAGERPTQVESAPAKPRRISKAKS